ncbi:HEPN domain-containing protein [Bradyrhizobium brasilense]|uniref:HEPN domain-containing protein n=1 Tax=Bradyrhizobium brasilense TaxID=1419277 RepID=UPI0024B0ED7E|nr:HEPN domain-containing protein [Bradyrhizobium australafricanum]WFU31472.1 HEPN domain-containing protein [Bradyrhizobium australafricanum]
MATNRNAGWVIDIEFVFTECMRIQNAISAAVKDDPSGLQDLAKQDMWGDLPHPNGKGTLRCGHAADHRIWRLAEQAVKYSDAAGTIEIAPVHKSLGKILVQRFLTERRPIDEQQAERALSSAVKEAKKARMNRTHYFPCRLMHSKEPPSFAIGPVTFYTPERFNELMAPHYETYLQRGGEDWKKESDERLLASAKHYYDGFTWVGEVNILNCDDGTSFDRARMAVTGAVNIVHILFGAYHTRRMDIGGPRLQTDRRAHMSLDPKHRLYISCSSAATSAVGFEDDWGKFLEGEDIAVLLRAANKALETVVNPTIKRTLGSRLLDSAAWFGDAVREESSAAQIIKAVTALERLVLTSEHEDIKKTVSQRSAAIRYDPTGTKSFEELERDLAEAYVMRSRLAHGSLSPFDPEVRTFAPVCLERIEQVICCGLGLFESYGLFDRELTNRQMADGFDGLVSFAQKRDAASEDDPA